MASRPRSPWPWWPPAGWRWRPNKGASLDLVPVVVGVLRRHGRPSGILFVYERPLVLVTPLGGSALSSGSFGRPRGDDEPFDRRLVVERAAVVRLPTGRCGGGRRLGPRQLALRLHLFRASRSWRSVRRSRGRACSSPTAPASWRPTCPSPRGAWVRWRAASPSPSPISAAARRRHLGRARLPAGQVLAGADRWAGGLGVRWRWASGAAGGPAMPVKPRWTPRLQGIQDRGLVGASGAGGGWVHLTAGPPSAGEGGAP